MRAVSKVIIFDLKGHKVYQATLEPGISKLEYRLANGIYVVQWISDKGIYSTKMVVLR